MICTAFLQPKRSKYLELIGVILQSISPILLAIIFNMQIQDFTVKHYGTYIAAAAVGRSLAQRSCKFAFIWETFKSQRGRSSRRF